MSDVTQILNAIEAGDAQAAAQLLPLVYDELRRLAAAQMAREKPGQTLDATGLVHEAYLRLVQRARSLSECGNDSLAHASCSFANRRHFFAAAAEAMRRILVERARHKKRLRHGGGWQRVELAVTPESRYTPDELLAFDDALAQLAREDSAAAEIVNLHVFAGLT